MLVTVQLQAQNKKPVKAPLPPPPMNVPPPPKPIPSYRELQELEVNPLEKLYVAFKTDPIYLKTDSAFIVQEMYFNPGGYGARISINNAMYPANYTQDSLLAKGGNVVLARSIETEYQDGKFPCCHLIRQSVKSIGSNDLYCSALPTFPSP